MDSSKIIWGHKPVFEIAKFKFVQDGNTLGTTDEVESIEIQLQTQLPGEKPFIVIKTETGWSIDEPKELEELLTKCLKSFEL